jgi:insertion element IS1 protein InsB
MLCKHCKSNCIRKGKRNNIQKYRCKICGKYSQERYIYRSYGAHINIEIVLFVKEGLGISSIARIQQISPKTVISRILKIGNRAQCPFPYMQGKSYDVDEMQTYVGNRETGETYIAYALERDTGYIVSLVVGRRTKLNLSSVIHTLLLRNAHRIFTDGLPIYGTIVPKAIHKVSKLGTARIERRNLTLRTHLKRLNRKTICYSKSLAMLTAVVKIYFWE